VPSAPEVQYCDITKNLPYPDNYFDACYSSHVLEHLTKEESQQLLTECHRILKPQGVIRVVVPDLEAIVREYLRILEEISMNTTLPSQEIQDDYDWIMLELYDQTVRNFSGGEMAQFLQKPNLTNKNYIRSRIGAEADKYWQEPQTFWKKLTSTKPSKILAKIKPTIIRYLLLILGKKASNSFNEGWFRNSGEVHRWMYDHFSLQRLLHKAGFSDIHVCLADVSAISDFNSYNLDIMDGEARKPDSLFIEAVKPPEVAI
ncbi:MAG: class I SAM-dependent methyltransferase, partial [Pseudanabaena sp.]